MSNTTNVAAAVIAATPIGMAALVVGGAVMLHRWLNNDTPEDVACVDNLKADQRRERLMRPGNATPLGASLTSATLHTRSAEPICRTAEKLGYRMVQPLSRDSNILLARPTGERLAIGRDNTGKVMVSAKNESLVKRLVSCHTVDSAISHLRGKGMDVSAQTLPSGEVQIIGQERQPKQDGAARVTTNVRSDGSMFIDVDNITSNRCGDIASELADAVGGSITDTNFKGPQRLPVTNRRRVRF